MPSKPPSRPRRIFSRGRIWTVVIASLAIIAVLATMARRRPQQPTVEVPVVPVTRSVEVNDLAADAVIPSRGPTWHEVDDPARDGWSSEVTAQQVSETLSRLGEAIFGGEPIDAEKIQQFCALDYEGTSLLPESRQSVFKAMGLEVERGADSANAATSPLPHRGAVGFESTLRDLAAAWSEFADKRFEFKLVRVTEQSGIVETKQYMAASGRSPGGLMEQHATWITHWSRAPESKQLRLQSIRVVDFEQTRARDKMFAECTPSILGKNDCYPAQFLFGLNYWLGTYPGHAILFAAWHTGLRGRRCERRWFR